MGIIPSVPHISEVVQELSNGNDYNLRIDCLFFQCYNWLADKFKAP